MKSSALLFAGLLVTMTGCYASGRPPENVNAAAKNVEVGTGKVLEGTGNLVEAGVNSAEADWKTPEDRRRRNQE